MTLKLVEVADLVWRNARETRFGESIMWEPSTFLTNWWDDAERRKTRPGKGQSGWYWFVAKISYQELAGTTRPSSLPDKGCNFRATADSNTEVLGRQALCEADPEGRLVVYNGHEKRVDARVRSHFSLSDNNHKTGAMGITHYKEFCRTEWLVRTFTSDQVNLFDSEVSRQIGLLVNSKTGRCAVESAWRTAFGWPVLCKQ